MCVPRKSKKYIYFIYLFDLFIYLFIYLFTYRFFGEKRLLYMQEFSLIIAAIIRKENCVNIALSILI